MKRVGWKRRVGWMIDDLFEAIADTGRSLVETVVGFAAIGVFGLIAFAILAVIAAVLALVFGAL
jgi:hypothetical protein